MAGGDHLNLFKMIETLQAAQGLQEVRLTQQEVGQSSTPKKKKYTDLADRLKVLAQRYNTGTLPIPDYLKYVAMNLVL